MFQAAPASEPAILALPSEGLPSPIPASVRFAWKSPGRPDFLLASIVNDPSDGALSNIGLVEPLLWTQPSAVTDLSGIVETMLPLRSIATEIETDGGLKPTGSSGSMVSRL